MRTNFISWFARSFAMNGCAQGFPGTVEELRGKTFGIIGYGSIGRETARSPRRSGCVSSRSSAIPLIAPPIRGGVRLGFGDPEGVIPEKFFGPEQREEIAARVRLHHRHPAAHRAHAEIHRCARNCGDAPRRVHREHRPR